MGLAVMGSNLARNFASRGHTVALFNRTQARTDHLMQTHGDEGSFLPASSIEQFVAEPGAPAARHHHGQGRRPHRRGDRRAGPAPRGRRHRRRRRQRPLRGHPPARGGAARARPALRRRRHLRRRGGRPEGTQHHAGRLTRVVRRPGAAAGEHLRQGRRRALLRLHGPRRRRPLRQDGAQRHRVRRHAVHRRGLRPAPRRRAGAPPHIADVFAEWNSGDLDSFLIEITAEVLRQVDAATGQPRWWTSSSTRPSRRAPAGGPCRSRSSWACRSTPSPSRCSPGPPPGTSTCARAAAGTLTGPDDRSVRGRRPAGRRRPRGAVVLQGGRLRPGPGHDPRGEPDLRLGHRRRRGGEDLARRLHHPRPAARAHPPGLQRARR